MEQRQDKMTVKTILIALVVWLFAALAAQADPLRNTSQFGVDMRAGPGFQFPLIHVLDPGEVADRGRCDLDGTWCLLTAGAKIGWVDTRGLAPPRSTLSQTRPLDPVRTPEVQATPLDGVSQGARPLPGAIVEAVRGAGGAAQASRVVAPASPGARAPFLLSTDRPFVNVTDGLVNLRAGPGTANPILGELRPGEGGLIDICDVTERWCRINVAGGPVAWVKMTLVGVRRITVPPLAADDRAR